MSCRQTRPRPSVLAQKEVIEELTNDFFRKLAHGFAPWPFDNFLGFQRFEAKIGEVASFVNKICQLNHDLIPQLAKKQGVDVTRFDPPEARHPGPSRAVPMLRRLGA